MSKKYLIPEAIRKRTADELFRRLAAALAPKPDNRPVRRVKAQLP